MAREYYTDSDNPDKVLWGLSWRGILVGFLLIVVCLAANWFTWGVKVLTSPIRGAGDVVIANNDAGNRVAAQAQFERLYNGIIAADKNLDVLAATMKAHPLDRIAQTTYDGAVMACNTFVADYNAEARKTLSVDWRTWDLPAQIDETNHATDCKENAR